MTPSPEQPEHEEARRLHDVDRRVRAEATDGRTPYEVALALLSKAEQERRWKERYEQEREHGDRLASEVADERERAEAAEQRARSAERMAAAVDVLVHTGVLDSRSLVADERLNYGDPLSLDGARSLLNPALTSSSEAPDG